MKKKFLSIILITMCLGVIFLPEYNCSHITEPLSIIEDTRVNN